MKDADFIVALERIPPEGLRLRATVEDAAAAGIELAVPQGGPMRLDLEVFAIGKRVRVRGEVEVAVHLNCSRCLREFDSPLKSCFETFLQAGEALSPSGDHELSPDEAEIQPLKGGAVDLRVLIAEQVHLTLPVKPLCTEGCEGLCPRCGRDLNEEACRCQKRPEDPRWEALRKLKV